MTGPLTAEEVQRFLMVHTREMGGMYANRAYAMDSMVCPWCEQVTLFAKAYRALDCGRDACMMRTKVATMEGDGRSM